MSQTFDPNGNLLSQTDTAGTTTYTWDARNRLSSLSGPSVTATFAYDALGRRIQKTINGQTTTFQSDNLDIVRESGTFGDASYLRTLAIDEALTRTDASSTVAYLGDALGSTMALIDPTAALTTEYSYEPFGRTQAIGFPASNPFQFTGRENDGTRLYYYQARYYAHGTGRFLQEDPLGLRTGVNRYPYVHNNPLRYVDPTGLWSIIVGGGATLSAPSGIDVSAGIVVNTSPPDIGLFGSVGPAAGVNVSADIFGGWARDVESIRGISTNVTVTVGPYTLTVLSDPITGEIIATTGGIGPPSPLPVGASISATSTQVVTVRDLIDWLRKRLRGAPDPCRMP